MFELYYTMICLIVYMAIILGYVYIYVAGRINVMKLIDTSCYWVGQATGQGGCDSPARVACPACSLLLYTDFATLLNS
jgi:hypothetical protein